MAEKVLEAWETKGRIHLREVVGDYNLKEERQRVRDLPRVIKSSQIPLNTVHQHFNSDSEKPARILSAVNNVYKMLDCDDMEQIENAPEFDGA